MERMELACCGLLASAFVLGGLLVETVQNRQVMSTAQGEMVLNRDNLTLMTTQTRPNEEAMFVLEANSGKLLIYKADITGKRIDLVQAQNLGPWFKMAEQKAAAAGGGAAAPR